MSSTAGIPRIILEFIVDILISSMNPLPLEALATEEFSVTRIEGLAAERRAFWNMCLVHRTWTEVVRRGLWHRVVLHPDNPIFRDISIHAASFSMTRELALASSGLEGQYWESIAMILRHAINLRKLYLDLDFDTREGENHFVELLRQLRSYAQLECLWLVGDMSSYRDILVIVSQLSQLKSLIIDVDATTCLEPLALHGLDPPANLKSIAVVDNMEWPCLSWLTCPRENYQLSNLVLTLDSPDQLEEDKQNPDLLEPFYQCLALLRTLQISTSSTDRQSEYVIQNDYLGQFLSRTRNLWRFTLACSSLRSPRLRLPDRLRVFHVHYDGYLDGYLSESNEASWQENDRNVASVISESSFVSPSEPVANKLQEVALSFVSGRRYIDLRILSQLESQIFPETRRACERAGITLKFETYASPYFGPIAESEFFI